MSFMFYIWHSRVGGTKKVAQKQALLRAFHLTLEKKVILQPFQKNQRWQLYAFHCLTNKTSRPLQFFPSTIFPQPSERFSQTNVLKPNNKKGTLIWHTNCSQKTYYQLLAIIEAINLEIAENSSTFRAAFQLWSGQSWTTLYALSLRKKIKTDFNCI